MGDLCSAREILEVRIGGDPEVMAGRRHCDISIELSRTAESLKVHKIW